jgi:hypothetical protein
MWPLEGRRLVAFAALLGGLVLLASSRQVDAACDVYCVGVDSYVGGNNSYYYCVDGKLCNQWWNATAGCKANDCDGAGSINIQIQQYGRGTATCPRLGQLGISGQATGVAGDPVGRAFNKDCYTGCQPKQS